MATAPVTSLLRTSLPTLQPSLARVATVVLQDTANAVGMSVTELAERAETSEASVIRLCKRIGVKGYAHLRLALAEELGEQNSSGETQFTGEIQPDDTLELAVRKIAYYSAKAVRETARFVSMEALRGAVQAVSHAPRTHLFGAGASRLAADDLQQKLVRVGRVAFSWPDVHGAMTGAALIRPGDVAIGISHSGRTQDTLDFLGLASSAGGITVAITSFGESPLAQMAHLVLCTVSQETAFRPGAMSSRMAQLAVADFLFTGVARSNLQASEVALSTTAAALRTRQGGSRGIKGWVES